MESWLSTLKDMAFLMIFPRKTFRSIKPKPLTLRPLWISTLLLFCSNAVSMLTLRFRGQRILAAPENWPQLAGQLDSLREIQTVSFGQLCIPLLVGPLTSIITIAILMYLFSAIFKKGTSFKQNIVLTSYAWCPMILVSILTTFLVIFAPIDRSLFVHSFFDLILPASAQGGMLYQILQAADPFYFWSLFLLATGASVLYEKGSAKWYVLVFLLLGLPAVLGVVGIITGISP